MVMEKRKEHASWRVKMVLAKYAADIAPFRRDGREAEFYRLHGPYEVIEKEGNLLLNVGIAQLWDLFIGAQSGASYTFANGTTTLGVGDSSTGAAAGQTDLQAASNKKYNAMDATYPSRSGQTVTFKSTYATSEANFAWNEWVIKQSTSAVCLNRKVESLGTKVSGTWVLTVTVTIS